MEQLLAQKNFRRIAEDAGRFLAASQNANPEKQAKLKEVLNEVKLLEGALMGAREMDRQGNSAGAWETVEQVAERFPDDLPAQQAKALYTTKAGTFAVFGVLRPRLHVHPDQGAGGRLGGHKIANKTLFRTQFHVPGARTSIHQDRTGRSLVGIRHVELPKPKLALQLDARLLGEARLRVTVNNLGSQQSRLHIPPTALTGRGSRPVCRYFRRFHHPPVVAKAGGLRAEELPQLGLERLRLVWVKQRVASQRRRGSGSH